MWVVGPKPHAGMDLPRNRIAFFGGGLSRVAPLILPHTLPARKSGLCSNYHSRQTMPTVKGYIKIPRFRVRGIRWVSGSQGHHLSHQFTAYLADCNSKF